MTSADESTFGTDRGVSSATSLAILALVVVTLALALAVFVFFGG